MSTVIMQTGNGISATPRSMDEGFRDRTQTQMHILAEMQVARADAETAYIDLADKLCTLGAAMRVFAQGFDSLTSFVKEGK